SKQRITGTSDSAANNILQNCPPAPIYCPSCSPGCKTCRCPSCCIKSDLRCYISYCPTSDCTKFRKNTTYHSPCYGPDNTSPRQLISEGGICQCSICGLT